MIKIYTNPGCYKCDMICTYLKQHHIGFKKLSANDHSVELIAKGFVSLPILSINDHLYSVECIEQLETILRRYKLCQKDQ